MICKYCGMDSTTTDRCSFCGHSLAPAPETPTAPAPDIAQERPAAAAPVAPGHADAEETPEPPLAARVEPGANPTDRKPAGPRKPAPAMMPQVSDRVKRGRETVQPIPEWVPWERAPIADASRPMHLSGDAPAAPEPERPHVSLSDPLAEHAIYMQNAPPGRTAPLLNADAEPAATTASATPTVTPAAPVAPPQPAATGRPAAAAPAARPPRRDIRDDVKPAVSAPTVPYDLLTRYAGIFALILIVAGALAYIGPAFYAVPLVLAQFAGALLLPVLRVVPWQDEDADDVVFFILLTLIFGPIISLVIYLVIGLMRQTVNPAIVGCMIVAALTRLVVEFALHTPVTQIISHTTPFSQLHSIDANLVKILLTDWSGMLALAGWYVANVFHKFDE